MKEKTQCNLGMDLPANSHLHRCQGCGTVWGHGNMMEADVAAHACPKCGKREWRVYQGGGRPQAQGHHAAVARPWYLQALDLILFVGAAAAAAYCVLIFVRELRAK
jgi:hypothetical protein